MAGIWRRHTFCGFSSAYSAILSTFYLPIMIMLFALIFRGVAFEYRFKSDRSKPWWDFAFSAGSTIAAFCQGIILGAIVQGVPVNAIELSSWVWLTPFSILTGFSVMAGYALLAACYLYMKSRDDMQLLASRFAKRLLLLILIFMMAVSLWTVLSQEEIRHRWFDGINFLLLSPLPIFSVILGYVAWRGLTNIEHESRPFWCVSGLFLLGFAGLVVSLFPYLIPRQLTFMEAAAPDSSLGFLLYGICIFVPLICAYTLWGYRVFSGKIEDYQEGY